MRMASAVHCVLDVSDFHAGDAAEHELLDSGHGRMGGTWWYLLCHTWTEEVRSSSGRSRGVRLLSYVRPCTELFLLLVKFHHVPLLVQ